MVTITQEKDGIRFLTYKVLNNFPIIHGLTQRHGGYSSGDLATLNLGFTSNADPEEVLHNRKKALLAITGKDYCYSLKQRHASVFHEATSSTGSVMLEGDGLYTNKPGVVLLILHADCQGTLIYDPKNHAIMGVHCGWKGLVDNVYSNAIHTMVSVYKSDPKDLLVFTSPSIGPEASEFKDYLKIFPKEFIPFMFKENYFNLWDIAKYRLVNSGVKEENFHCASICTYTNFSDYFSFRKNKKTGRLGTFVMLKEPV